MSSSSFEEAAAGAAAPVKSDNFFDEALKALRSVALNELMWLNHLKAWNKSPSGAVLTASKTSLSTDDGV